MPWLLASPGHQQPWHWLCSIGRFCLTRGRIPTCLVSVQEWHKLQIHVLFSLKIKHVKGWNVNQRNTCIGFNWFCCLICRVGTLSHQLCVMTGRYLPLTFLIGIIRRLIKRGPAWYTKQHPACNIYINEITTQSDMIFFPLKTVLHLDPIKPTVADIKLSARNHYCQEQQQWLSFVTPRASNVVLNPSWLTLD